MASVIRKLPANSKGKDYVIGDLHGCFELLMRLLDKVGFDKSKDRLFSVGDLIDRGPESLNCLNLLAQPWFYAVQGNHENMMLNFFLPYLLNGSLDSLDDINDTGFLDYGGEWVEQHFLANQKAMSSEFNRGLAMALELPLIWVVGEQENRFHVIHAELIRPDYRVAEKFVWLDNDIDFWLAEGSITPGIEDRLYWSRTLMSQQNTSRFQPGLSATFCGHTYATRPHQVLSHICLDTGAFISINYPQEVEDYGLTLCDVRASCWYSASYQRDEIVSGKFICNN